MAQMEDRDILLLNAEDDRYGGVIIKVEEPVDSTVFDSLLQSSMLNWREQGKKVVWIKLPMELANLVETAVKAGFSYHHAEADCLILVYWLPNTADALPANASQRSGIGTFVINDNREVLVVQPGSGRFEGHNIAASLGILPTLAQSFMASDQEAFSSIDIYGSIQLNPRILFWGNLTELDLSYSKNLIQIPDFSELPNLRRLNLEGCTGLVEIHSSVGQHKSLQVLNLTHCKGLRAICPEKLEMAALKQLIICWCRKVKCLPEFGESMKNVKTLDAKETGLVKFPESLGLLTGLEALNVRGCKNLVCFPLSIRNLKRLREIDICGCSKLARLSLNFDEMDALKELDASETNITAVPASTGGLEKPARWSFLPHKRSTSKYDIFLSFRGEDTRRGFTSHLYYALSRSGFKVFMDDEELRKGEAISRELLQAIEKSLFAIVILSENYASSSWCLDELQHILFSRNELGQIVFPIFYHVDPSDVRRQRKNFGEAWAKLKHKFQHDQQKVRKWRYHLKKVASLSGFDSRIHRNEAVLIESVVDHLWGQLRSKLPLVSPSDALIGIERRVDEMLSVLGIGLGDVRFIGVWGMGGVGKTTLARTLYLSFQHQFDFHYFLANVREVSERNGLVPLQNQLLSCLNIRNIQIEDIHEGKKTIGYHFRNRKVMLILDDVNSISQLENLAARREWFGEGSRIIITTRDAQLLGSHGVDEIYKVKPMNHDESLQLFFQKAFTGDPPRERLRELSESVINYSDGLPLALSVLGSFFSGQEEIEWEKALDVLKKDSNNGVFKILRLSYEALNHVEKTIFLDVACFFNMWGKDEVKQILESCGLEATVVIKNLIDKSLLVEAELGNIKYIEMHELVQEMGRQIVFDESRYDVGRRSRLWISDDIDLVLNENLGTRATEGVVLPFTFAKDEACWDPTSFLGMRLLQLLITSCNFNLPLGLKGFPSSLKVFHWYGYPCEALPSTKQMSQLVNLKMQNSKIKRLSADNQPMKKLKVLDLSHSKNLLQTPKFYGFQNLEKLVLEGCTSLIEVDSFLGQLQFLVEVNLKGCLNLKVLPKKLEMNSLEHFVLCGCIQVRNLPEFGEEMKRLRTLDASGTRIAKLPESLGSLTSIETLELKGCKNLVGLPHDIYKLKRLKVLDISGCPTFSELPENLDENEALEKLDASGTAITEVPSSICYLKKLKVLAFNGRKNPTSNSSICCLPWDQMFQRHSFPQGLIFPVSIFNIESLTELDLSYCDIGDGMIPHDLGDLSSLHKLDMSGNKFVNLPDGCISNLLDLRSFYLNSCPKLQLLPQPSPSLSLMDAGECSSLRALSDIELLNLFASIEQDGQHAEGLRRILATFSVTIPGSQIPSWFENQNHLPLNGRHAASVTIDIPEDKWLGIGLCTVIDDKICRPRWGFDFKASDGKYVSLPGRTRGHEKEIKSCHLWIVFWKIKEEYRDELSRKCSQIRLKFYTDWEQPTSTSVDVDSIKCGWCFIRKRDLELLMDGESTISSEDEHRQCNLLQSETSHGDLFAVAEPSQSKITEIG